MKALSFLQVSLVKKQFVPVRFLENSVHFFDIIAFVTKADELQALLNACSTTRDWEMLTESILITDEWIPIVYARLSELRTQDILVSILFRLSSCLMMVYVSTLK